MLPTLVSEITWPRFANEPWMRSYPQLGFSWAKRSTSLTTSAEVGGPPNPLGASAVIPLCSHQFSVSAQNRIWSHNQGHLLKHLPPENLTFDRQTTSLVIIEQDALFAELLSEHTILGSKVFDNFLFSMIDPAGEDQNKQLPRLQDEFHTTADGVGSKGNSIPDQRVAVNQPKQNLREPWQESSFQPHADRPSFFTLRGFPIPMPGLPLSPFSRLVAAMPAAVTRQRIIRPKSPAAVFQQTSPAPRSASTPASMRTFFFDLILKTS